jgi:hypothetical protein
VDGEAGPGIALGRHRDLRCRGAFDEDVL